MGQFKVKEIHLHYVLVPLKKTFSTHLQTVTTRESIFVEMIDSDGVIGLGECVAFSSPWYTEETVKTCWESLVNWLIPTLVNKEINHPSEFGKLLNPIKGNRMAKASLDQAAWDLFARKKEMPLWKLLGGVRQKIDAGIVLTGNINKEMFEAVQMAKEIGYTRVKLKIDQNTNPSELKKLIESAKEMHFFADANGIFDSLGLKSLLKFDGVGLSLLEQPFGEDEWSLHTEATRLMETPIALDESLRSIADVERMAVDRSGSVIVLKPGRVGGITNSLEIIHIAEQYELPIWIGGMIEFGVSKAHNLALASLPQFSLPGDFSATTHFWNEEPVEPAVIIQDGGIQLSNNSGIGVHLNREILEKYTVKSFSTNK